MLNNEGKDKSFLKMLLIIYQSTQRNILEYHFY